MYVNVLIVYVSVKEALFLEEKKYNKHVIPLGNFIDGKEIKFLNYLVKTDEPILLKILLSRVQEMILQVYGKPLNMLQIYQVKMYTLVKAAISMLIQSTCTFLLLGQSYKATL